MSTDLATFLLARIAEDEALARAATASPWVPDDQGWTDAQGNPFIQAPYHELVIAADDVQHITRWQPARVLAECEAKRRIVGRYQRSISVLDRGVVIGREIESSRANESRAVLCLLALPYADHPDYLEWRP